MVFDKLFTKYFMEELAKNINKKDAYSLTTYSIIYKLIQEKKLKIIFNVALFKRGTSSKMPQISDIAKTMFPEKKGFRPIEYHYRYPSLINSPASVKANDEIEQQRIELNASKAMKLAQGATGKLANFGWKMATGWDTSTRITLKGGYNPNKRTIKILCWLYIGIEWEKFILDKPFKKVYNQILAALLHEGIFIYNSVSNGASLDNYVVDWYKNYFAATIMAATNKATVARYCADYLGKEWAKYMYTNIEKYLIKGYEPLMKEKIVEDKKKSYIKSTPLISDYIKGPFKNLVGVELPTKYNLDVATMDDIQAYVKDFIEFVSFMYFNRNESFSLKSLKEVPKFSSIFPKDGKVWSWDGKCLGFEIVGDYKFFDDAYDNIYDIKDAYENSDKFFKKTYIFSEMFLPSTIQAKDIYYSVLRNNVDDKGLRLIDCATKGLSVL